MEDLLEEAVNEGIIICRKCGNRIEPDCPTCGECSWKNPLVSMGYM